MATDDGDAGDEGSSAYLRVGQRTGRLRVAALLVKELETAVKRYGRRANADAAAAGRELHEKVSAILDLCAADKVLALGPAMRADDEGGALEEFRALLRVGERAGRLRAAEAVATALVAALDTYRRAAIANAALAGAGLFLKVSAIDLELRAAGNVLASDAQSIVGARILRGEVDGNA